MLIAGDLVPLRGCGRYRCGGETVDEWTALQLVGQGRDVEPADAATCEDLAAKIDAGGNDVRAAMFRRWGAAAFGKSDRVTGAQLDAIQQEIMGSDPVTVPDTVTSSELPPPETSVPPPPPSPSDAAADAAAAAKREVDEAGDDRALLMRLASRAGVEVFGFQKVDRIRSSVLNAIAVRVAQGKPPLQD